MFYIICWLFKTIYKSLHKEVNGYKETSNLYCKERAQNFPYELHVDHYTSGKIHFNFYSRLTVTTNGQANFDHSLFPTFYRISNFQRLQQNKLYDKVTWWKNAPEGLY